MSKQLLSVLIVLAISAILFIILYFASGLINLVIAIPLIMIINIIIENIAMKYVCHFGNKIVNKTKTNVKTKKQARVKKTAKSKKLNIKK
ncbi:MAG: hypothetical protein MJ223_03935 [Mycoplasmoidaceae bacterium]|nr:hypothetical protein [Mycoplasmoidaceae bacterium]